MSRVVYLDRVFDRIPSPTDARNRNADYPVAAVLEEFLTGSKKPKATLYDALQDARITALEHAITPAPTPTPGPQPAPPAPIPPGPAATMLWPCLANLDQLRTGMCEGFGNADWAQAGPFPKQIVLGSGDDEKGTADLIYDIAQAFDGSPADPNAGASSLGGAHGLTQLSLAASYSWASAVPEIAAAIRTIGPVVMGTDWYEGMMNPDGSGMIQASGKPVGGHCYLLRGVNTDGSVFRLRNSWGIGWGLAGDAYLGAADLANLLAAQGDACVPLKAAA